MCALLNSLIRDRCGTAVVEFALFVPILMILFLGLTEVGRAHYQAVALEKGLRAGALYAARNEFPLSDAAKTATGNLVRTGRLDGTPPYMVAGWAGSGSGLQISSADFDVDGTPLPVVRLTATVPFVPLIPGLGFLFGVDGYKFRLSHEQAYIGD